MLQWTINWLRQECPTGGRRSAIALHGALVALLLLGGWLYTAGVEDVVDVMMSDESAYLYYGVVDNPVNGPRSAAFAPLYVQWYRTLSWFEPDQVELYYLNQRLMTVLPALAFFLVLRAFSVSPLVAVSAAWLLLISAANFPIGPKVSHFALTTIFCGLAVVSRLRRPETKVAACGVLALLASFARPEFFLAHLGIEILAVVLLVNAFFRGEGRQTAPPIVAGLFVSLVLVAVVGKPMEHDRSIRAFQQHFALNYVTWGDSDLHPWTDGGQIYEQHFGDARSVTAAAWANPAAFATHLLRNAYQLGPAVSSRMFSTHPRQLSVPLILLALVSVFAFWGGRSAERLPDRLRENVMNTRWSLAGIAILMLPGLLACLVIHPRFHYLLIAQGLLVLAVLLVLARSQHAGKTRGTYVAAFCVAFLFLVMQAPLSSGPHAPQPNLATIRHLRSLELTQPTALLVETDAVYGAYLGETTEAVPTTFREPDETLDGFLEAHSVGMILASETTPNNSRFKGDEDWKELLGRPAARGFAMIPVSGVPGKIVLVRKHLLPAGATGTPAAGPLAERDVPRR